MIILNDEKERLRCNSANLKTAILEAEQAKKPITFYTHARTYCGDFVAIDRQNEPIVLGESVLRGGLVYYKINRFEWRIISVDDVDKIEIA